MKLVKQEQPRGNACLEAAISYAGKGWHIFPVPPGEKKSYLSAKFSGGRRWGASNKERHVRRFFRKFPDANVGIATGAISGIFVFEVDTPKGHNVDGFASLEKLQAKHRAMPKTLQAISPSGSLHFYYKCPRVLVRNSASEIAPGIDVRGDGGMVIAPPSVKPRVGIYRWVNHLPIAKAPRWLLEMVTSDRAARSISERATALIRKPVKSLHSVAAADVRAALEVIANGCDNCGHWPYAMWFEIGCALHAEFGDAGFELFRAFSMLAPTYDGRSCLAKWRECAKIDAFTTATIFYHAEHYVPRWRAIYEARRLHQAYSIIRASR